MEPVLGPVVKELLSHECLTRPEGLAGGDAGWRGVVSGLELLVTIKSIASMITCMPEFNPPEATAPTIETLSLMGPLCRLGVFGNEWVRKCFLSDFHLFTVVSSRPSRRRISLIQIREHVVTWNPPLRV